MTDFIFAAVCLASTSLVIGAAVAYIRYDGKGDRASGDHSFRTLPVATPAPVTVLEIHHEHAYTPTPVQFWAAQAWATVHGTPNQRAGYWQEREAPPADPFHHLQRSWLDDTGSFRAICAGVS